MTQVATGGYQPASRRNDGLVAGDFKVDSIDLYLTSTCNRRCTYCFLSDQFLSSKTRMSLETVNEIIAWAATGGTIRELTLLGGEPALHPQFDQIIELIDEAGLSARTVTNGSRQFRAAAAKPGTRAGLDRVSVSFDSPTAEVFDQIRGRNAFADVMATIEQLRRQKMPFEINYTVLKSTIDDVSRMIHLAESLGAERLNIHWFSLVGRARKHARDEVVSAHDWRDRVLEPVRQYSPPRADFVVDCELGYAYGLPGEDTAACATRGLTNLQFFPSGAVFACGMLVEDEHRSGYVWRDGQLYERAGASELTETKVSCSGCPLRTADENFEPLCIYNRLKL